MTLARKTLVVGLLLVAFALWPLLHRLVVTRYFVSPWRLFGWAMYCVPVYRPEVTFFAVHDGERRPLALPRADRDDALVYERFVRQRAELGTLVAPEELGEVLFRRHPLVDRLVVRISQPVYHYDSDTIRHAYFEYELERRGDG